MRHTLSDSERRAWLRLARTSNVGPVTFAQLITRFGAASRALAELPRLAHRGGGRSFEFHPRMTRRGKSKRRRKSVPA
jgi:predicted Rossmann fold nucleotide-binding protein DprA/Smf involved in DNA uptake